MAAAFAVLASVLFFYRKGQQTERYRNETNALRNVLHQRQTRQNVEYDLARVTDPDDELRKRWSRD